MIQVIKFLSYYTNQVGPVLTYDVGLQDHSVSSVEALPRPEHGHGRQNWFRQLLVQEQSVEEV